MENSDNKSLFTLLAIVSVLLIIGIAVLSVQIVRDGQSEEEAVAFLQNGIN